MQTRGIDSDPHPFAVDSITDEEGFAMFRAALNIFRNWGISDNQAAALLDLPTHTFVGWKDGLIGPPGREQKVRLSYLMGIHKSLRNTFSDPARGYLWITKPNKALNGQSALDIMLHGEITDLMRVRRYLDAGHAGW